MRAEVVFVDEVGDRPRTPTPRSVAGTVAVLIVFSVAFALLPWDRISIASEFLVGVTFGVGLVGTGWLVFAQAMSYRQAAGSGSERLRGLLVAVYLAVLFFATAYYLLERTQPGELVGLSTRLDSLYFALTVLSTVGFGDIHAVGQTARAMVSAQIVFDVLVISLAVGAVRDVHRVQRQP